MRNRAELPAHVEKLLTYLLRQKQGTPASARHRD
jgi:hypothetical protein